MDSVEKRYFRKFSNGKCLELFKLLEKQESYDLEKLKKKFSTPKDLSTWRVNLKDLIFKSMRTLNENNRLDQQLTNAILDARFLIDKERFKLAEKILQGVIETGLQNDLFQIVLKANHLVRFLLPKLTKKVKQEDQQALQRVSDFALERMILKLQLTKVQDQLYHLLNKDLFSPLQQQDETLVKIKSFLDSLNEENCDGIEIRKIYLFIQAQYFHLINLKEKSFESYEKLIQHFDEHNILRLEQTREYVSALNNFWTICFLLRKLDMGPTIIKKLKTVAYKSPKDQVHLQFTIYRIEMVYYLNTWDKKNAKMIIPKLTEFFEEKNDAFDFGVYCNFQYNVLCFNFISEDFEDAFDSADKIIKSGKNFPRQDIQDAARLFKLIIEYELGRLTSLESSIRNIIRYYKDNERNYPLANFFIGLLKQIISNPLSKGDLKKLYCQALKEFKELNSTLGSLGIGSEELEIWLTAKCNDLVLWDVGQGGLHRK